MESIASRNIALNEWLRGACGLAVTSLLPLPGDASFRRYFRVVTSTETLIAMDAPPPEQCGPFVAIAGALRGLGLQAPDIKAADIERGYLLLTDFGDATYLKSLNNTNADKLYRRALEVLAVLQSLKSVPGYEMQAFDADFMQKEWAWHKEWFLGKLLNVTLSAAALGKLDACYARLVDAAVMQPQVFMHRDYHGGNLMVVPTGHEVGILDFQDAVIGPVTYDAVSLLRDCYVDWPEDQVTEWAASYWKRLCTLGVLPGIDVQTFLRWFDWMGIQRHLKAIFIFSRKQIRDQHPQYLAHIPRALNYVKVISARYPELAPLHEYVTMTEVEFERVMSSCEQ